MEKEKGHLNQEIDRIKKIDGILNNLEIHYKSAFEGRIKRKHVFELYLSLDHKCNFDWPGDLWDIDITFNDAVEILSDFDFTEVLNPIETDIDIIPSDFPIQYKVRVKSKGLLWIIHKSDKDTFPSKPHAHLLNNNIKLDLSTGECFKKKDYVYKIKKKDLLKIRKKAEKRIELPELKV